MHLPPIPRFQRLSLKAQLALAIAGVLGSVLVALLGLTLWVQQRELRDRVAQVQQTLTDSLARGIDEKIAARREALLMHAAVLSQTSLHDAEALERHFETRPTTRALFDVLLVADADGRILFDSPAIPGRRGSSIAGDALFQRAMGEGASVVTLPFEGRLTHKPAVGFAAPLRAPDGRVVGMLAGTLYLDQPNFLGAVGATALGTEGYFAIVTREAVPHYVMHRDARRLLDPVPTALREAVRGDDGLVELGENGRVDVLLSRRSLSTVPWVLCGFYPAREAYALLQERDRQVLAAGAALALLGGLALWAFVGRVLRPLQALREAMHQQAEHPGTPLPPLQADSRELAAVVRAFRVLMDSRAAIEADLLDNQHRLQMVTDNMPVLIAYIDREERYRFANAQYDRLYGLDPQDMLGRTIAEAVGETVYAQVREPVAQALAGQRVQFERELQMGGVHLFMSFEYIPDRGPDGRVLGFYVMGKDITERKRAEAAREVSEKRLRAIADNLPALISHVDNEERYQFLNAHFRRAFDVEPERIVGKTVLQFRGEEVYRGIKPHMDAVLRGEQRNFESSAVIGGREYHFTQAYVPDLDADGRVQGYFSLMLDITERKQSALKLAESERRLRTITDNIPALITYIDREQRFGFCNETLRDWLGVAPEDALGRTMREVLGEALYEQRRSYIERALAGERLHFEVASQLHGEERHLHTVYVPHLTPDDRVAGFYTMSFDVTAMKRVEQQLSQLARFDELTGLPNRRQFDERLRDAMARCRRNGRPMALMYLDLDHFKQVNDSLGHAGGDAVLKEFAARVSASVRATDTVARLAGDEFIVILEGLNTTDEAQFVARKIVANVRRPFQVDDRTVPLSTSIGITYYSGEVPLTAEELTDKADRALYQVKGSGRDTYRMVVC